MQTHATRPEEIETVDDERHFTFLTGFPCTNATCSGRLTRGRFDRRPAVVCGVCEEVYYVLADEGAPTERPRDR